MKRYHGLHGLADGNCSDIHARHPCREINDQRRKVECREKKSKDKKYENPQVYSKEEDKLLDRKEKKEKKLASPVIRRNTLLTPLSEYKNKKQSNSRT